MNDINDRWTEHDHIAEGSLRSWLAQERPLPADRDAQLDTVFGRIHEAPGARRRFLWWLGRDATARRRRGQRDLTPHTQSRRNSLMFSITGLAAALAVLALSVNVITTDNEPLSAGGAVLGVAADGSGDHTTIAEALAEARNGDTILVAPGTYQEALLIDKNVTIRGDGPREDVVITAYADPDMWPATSELACQTESVHPGCAVLIDHASPSFADLTFKGDFAGIYAFGGAPILERLTLSDIGIVWPGGGERAGEPLVLLDGTRLSLRDSELLDSRRVWIDRDGEPTIEHNTFAGGTDITAIDAGDAAVIRGNRIDDAQSAIALGGPTKMLIEGNVISGSDEYGISVGAHRGGPSDGVDPVIRDNTIAASGRIGIQVEARAAPVIEGNRFTGNPTGIQFGESAGVATGNEITDGKTGIIVVSRGTPTITDNTIDVTGRGIVAGAGTSPVISGNTVCGADTSIHVAADAAPELGENQTCEVDVTG